MQQKKQPLELSKHQAALIYSRIKHVEASARQKYESIYYSNSPGKIL